jgi:hypothetical protein
MERTPKPDRFVSDADGFYRVFSFILILSLSLDDFEHEIVRSDGFS